MANVPSNVSYGKVTGRFILAYGDTLDSGLEPDATPAAGSVFFTASPVLLKNASASPSAVTILPATVEVPLDSDGNLRAFAGTDGLGVRLVATDDPQNNPVGWTWRVDFRLTDQAGVPVSLPSFSFSLPSDSTVDLTELSPVPSADGTFYLVGPTGPANSLSVGTVTTGDPGTSAQVQITGTPPAQTVSFTIPRGTQGIQGEQGIQGIQGEKGDQGDQGIQGEPGSLANLNVSSPVTYDVETSTVGFDWSETELDDLGDVSAATPNNKDMLKWNETSGVWENSNIIDGGTA